MANTRATVARVLYAVVHQKQQLKPALSKAISQFPDAQDRAWVQSVCYHSIRHFYQLQARWQKFTPKKVKDELVSLILTSALTQKFHLHTPDHAIVNEAIKALRKLKKPWACGLANKVLRLALKDDDFQPGHDEERYNHPQWLIDAIKQDWPNDYQQILTANVQKPPMWVRLNTTTEMPGDAHPYIQHALKIPASDIREIPEFRQGQLSVQDASAQLAAYLLDPQSGEKILDVCAAPGGKTCHLLQLCPDIELTAVEKNADRINSIQENLERIRAQATIVQGDATKPENWAHGQHFDKILADVPCSATGVIRRHPDIKLHRQPQDIKDLVRLQRNILQAISALLPVNGTLLYATCSVLAQENWQQMADFLNKNKNFEEQKIQLKGPIHQQHGIQIRTGDDDADGFYYCLLKKIAA
ncbi:16S rRNA (cytosine(967)-C(5))-methyltransferase RsmB [Marinicella sp. W31]|uniref:16S rRNA (cytosine(967)-C(5))-methyltransferase RsmB n=1 Tax=Marinicella sp. W31 TaxID=3023713 RepID=UPI003756F850